MNLEPCTPIPLPPKHVDWEFLAPWIGRARELLARYDETIRSVPPAILEILKWEESIASLRAQDIEAELEEVLRFAFNASAEEKRAPLLQKILNAKEALDFAMRYAKQKPLNLSFLCRVHSIVKRDAPNRQEIGRLRKRQNWIGPQGGTIAEASFLPPKPLLVPRSLANWGRYLNQKTEPLAQLAILFAQLLVIHPFMDGNGRVARIYIPVFLWKKKLLSQPFFFLSIYFETYRLQYFQKLFHISKHDAWTDWIHYFLQGLIDQSQHMKAQVESLVKLYKDTKQLAPFLHPISLKNQKHFSKGPRGLFMFKDLLHTVNRFRDGAISIRT